MFLGNQKNKKFLDRCLERDNLNHAYLFVGPSQVGKFTLARLWAQKLTGSTGEINPNLIVISPPEKEGRKKDINVEVVRDLASSLSRTSINNQHRVAIIDGAEHLNKSAQNALLKTLEEPPKKSILILITSDPRQLLPTIKSRCQVIKFNLVAEEEIEKMIPENNSQKKKIVFWSCGRPGLARKFLEESLTLDWREKQAREFQNIFNSPVYERMSFVEKMISAQENLEELLSLWLILLRKNILEGSNSQLSERSVTLIEKIKEAQETIAHTNANQRLILENLTLLF